MTRTIAYALDFALDTLDFSPDETIYPSNEQDLKKQVTADPIATDYYAVVLWNDEKHSFDDVIQHVRDATGCSTKDASDIATRVDAQVLCAHSLYLSLLSEGFLLNLGP